MRLRAVPFWPTLIGLVLLCGLTAVKLRESASTMPEALLFQACDHCRFGLYPNEDALWIECPKCGHVSHVRSRWNPTEGEPDDQPNKD